MYNEVDIKVWRSLEKEFLREKNSARESFQEKFSHHMPYGGLEWPSLPEAISREARREF